MDFLRRSFSFSRVEIMLEFFQMALRVHSDTILITPMCLRKLSHLPTEFLVSTVQLTSTNIISSQTFNKQVVIFSGTLVSVFSNRKSHFFVSIFLRKKFENRSKVGAAGNNAKSSTLFRPHKRY